MSFFAYSKTAEGQFLERFGLDFEDFQIGQHFHHRPGLTVSQQDNVNESLETMNAAMIHYDNNYAEKTVWKKPLIVSTITLQLMIGMSSKTFSKRNRILRFENISMTAPVFGGDTLYSDSEIIAIEDLPNSEFGKIEVLCQAKNQNGIIVSKVKYDALVWRRNKGPILAPDHIKNLTSVNEPRFDSYKLSSENNFVEQTGLFFEDFNPNETFIHWPCRTFSSNEAPIKAWQYMEISPQFHDSAWLKSNQKCELAITQTWVLGAATALTTRTFGRVVANLGWHDAEFHNDTLPGDTLRAESTILDKRISKSRINEGILTVSTSIFNQKNIRVISYVRNLLVYKKNAETPYTSAGY